MNFTFKTLGLIGFVCLLAGFLLGFIPKHRSRTRVENRVTALTNQGDTTQKSLRQTQNQLTRSQFAVQAAVVSDDANANNYADADAEASKLFTALRQYLDSARDDAAAPVLTEILSARDQTIAGLAKADPGTRPELVRIFKKLQSLSTQTAQ